MTRFRARPAASVRHVLLLGLLGTLAQCGGEGTTQPPQPPPPPPPENVPPLSDQTKQTMCALSELARLLASTQQQNSSSISSQQDCKVSDVPEVLATNPQSTGFFESLYLQSDRSQQVEFTASAGFDAAMALFQVVASQSSSVSPSGTGPVVRTSQSGYAETLTLLGSNDDRSPSDPNPRLLITLQPGVGYLVVVSGFDAAAAGGYTLSMDPVTPSEPPPPPAPAPGAIRVSNTTTGTPDPDGYTAVVNDRKSKALGINGQVEFTNLAPGDYSVALQGVDATCSVISPNPQTVSVGSNTTSSVQFDVNCQVAVRAGNLRVQTTTSGGSPDPDGYTVTLDGGQSRAIGNNGTVTYTGVSEGSHSVRLTGLASNCSIINGANPRNVDVTAGQTAQTTFDVNCPTSAFSLSVAGGGDGDGVVTSSPAGIDCTIVNGDAAGGSCNTTFPQGTQVTLIPTPTSSAGQRSTFSGWSGDCSGGASNPACAVTMDQARSVTAAFQQEFELVVQGAGSGTGTVTGQGINCAISAGSTSGTCRLFYTAGTGVTLNATSSGQDTFQGWSGACTGTGSCAVTLNQPRSVTATFGAAPGPPTISNPRHQFVTLGQCGIQGNNRIRYTVDFTDPDGDVNGTTVKVHVTISFSNGGGNSYVSDPGFNSTTGDGFAGTVTADNCLLYGSAIWADVTLQVEDAAGNISNSVTMRVDKPGGAT